MATNEKRRKQKRNRKVQRRRDRGARLEELRKGFSWVIPFLVMAGSAAVGMASGRGADISWNNVKVHVAPPAEPSNTATHEEPHE